MRVRNMTSSIEEPIASKKWLKLKHYPARADVCGEDGSANHDDYDIFTDASRLQETSPLLTNVSELFKPKMEQLLIFVGT